MVYRLCLAYLGRDGAVEDLFQDIFLKIWKYLDSFKGEASISTWIYRIATNTALQYRQKNSRQKKNKADYEAATSTNNERSRSVDIPMDQGLQMNELLRVIHSLKKVDRIVITLALEGFSYQEIGDITGLKVNHIGVKINRIKKQLKKSLNTHGRFN